MEEPVITITFPKWVNPFLARSPQVFSTTEDRMRFVIELSRQNTRHQTGGPFGAAVFDSSGRLVSIGVNMVVRCNCSVLHAEILALILAQQRLGRYDIGDGCTRSYDLFASTEPCVMCFGAVHWSGVSRLVCGARDEDARSIGFDEGPKRSDWVSSLEIGGISVVRDILRQEAIEVLREYAESGGILYNPGQPSDPSFPH